MTSSQMHVLFLHLAVTFILHIPQSMASGDIIRAQQFLLCPKGTTFSGQVLFSVAARSDVDCMTRCLETDSCLSVNVCPTGLSGHVKCGLLSDRNAKGCDGLGNAGSDTCFFSQKLCENGGIPVKNSCACPVQYSGKYCERYIRDCREAYDNGHTSSSLTGVYLIQPVSAPAPFKVKCTFSYQGAMYVLQRKTSDFKVDWNTARNGFGEVASSKEFFVGLENLHHLTCQARYEMLVWYFGSPRAGAFYYNVTVGAEKSRYVLAYDRFAAGSNAPSTENGLAATGPLLFSTKDHDVSQCASTRGAPGWYGAGCEGYSVFASPPTWPVGGSNTTATSLFISIQRISDGFHED